jgi:hypothetical protein
MQTTLRPMVEMKRLEGHWERRSLRQHRKAALRDHKLNQYRFSISWPLKTLQAGRRTTPRHSCKARVSRSRPRCYFDHGDRMFGNSRGKAFREPPRSLRAQRSRTVATPVIPTSRKSTLIGMGPQSVLKKSTALLPSARYYIQTSSGPSRLIMWP